MKKILFLVALLPFIANAQPYPVYQGQPTQATIYNGTLGALRGIKLPHLDSSKNYNWYSDIYINKTTGKLMYRDSLNNKDAIVADSDSIIQYANNLIDSSFLENLLTSSGMGDIELNNTKILFCGHSTTWQRTALGSGYDYWTTTFRRNGQSLQNTKGYVNFGSSGFPLSQWVNNPLQTIPPIDEVNNLGIGSWDTYGHNVQTAISLATCMAYRATLTERIIWHIDFGANDIILYNQVGNLPQNEIEDYLFNLLVTATERIKKAFPEDVIIYRVMNPMVARPYNPSAGFPSATAYPNFGDDLADDVALMNKWNYAMRNAYLKMKGRYAKTFVFDTWKSVYGFIDASVNANTLPFMVDLVHPSSNGYIAEMDELMNLFVPNKEPNLGQKRRADLSASLNGGTPWDYYANYFEGSPYYKRLFIFKNIVAGAGFIDIGVSKAEFDNALLGRAFYIEIDNVGAQKISSYTVNSTGANNIRITGVSIISTLQAANGKAYLYVDADVSKTTDPYVKSQVITLKPREAYYGRVVASGSGYIDITFDQVEGRLSTKHLYNANKGLLIVGGAISANITDLNTWTITRSGGAVNRGIRMTKAGDWSAYTVGTLVALTYNDLVVPPVRYEGILNDFAPMSHAQNNTSRVVAKLPMVDGVTLSIGMTEGLVGQSTTVEIFATRSNNRTSLGTITVNPNALSGSTTINVSTSVVEGQVYEAVITSNTTQTTGLVVLKMTPN